MEGRSLFKKLFAMLLCSFMVFTLVQTTVFADDSVAWIGSTGYATLKEAIDAVPAGQATTITLKAGEYSTYKNVKNEENKGKILTFVGAGTSETTWIVGAKEYQGLTGEYNGDYSFDGASSITFENMTLQVGNQNYLGFIRADVINTNNCVINGRLNYWGISGATFTNTTFNNANDYVLWDYGCENMTFDRCTFNVDGKVINAYCEHQNGDYVINVKNCTVNSTIASKSMVNIKNANNSYTVNFTGTNTMNGLDPNIYTCSRLFQVGDLTYSHNVVVKENGTTIWNNGMVNHDYLDGYADNAFTVREQEVSNNIGNGIKTYYVAKVCDYCGYTETYTKIVTPTEEVVLDGDILINDDTEHTAVYEASSKADTLKITGSLDIAKIQDQMKAIEEQFGTDEKQFANIKLSDIDFTMTATLQLPEELDVSNATVALNDNDSFEVKDYKIDGTTVTVVMGLKDVDSITTYKLLRDAVFAYDTLNIDVSNVTFADSAVKDTNYTVTGTVEGSFSATASNAGAKLDYTATYTSVQSADGRDAIASEDDNTIQATLKYTEKSVISDEDNEEPTDDNQDNDSGKTTGDDVDTSATSNAGIYLAMMAIAGAGIVTISKKNRK